MLDNLVYWVYNIYKKSGQPGTRRKVMSAKGMCDIGYKQGSEFFTALEKAGFTGDIIQQVINSPRNQMAVAMYATVTTVARVLKPRPDKFELLTTFEITVPQGYNHATRLSDFKVMYQPEVETEERKKHFCFYNQDLTDANYSKATTKLVPGRKLQVKVFGIKSGKSVSSNQCLTKLRSENAILVGAQGASIAYEQGKDKLPKDKWSISFDEKDVLWFNNNEHMVPCVSMYSDGAFYSRLFIFEGGGGWDDVYCLFCFCDLPAGEETLVA